MQIKMLKAKLHRACVTDSCLEYEGSCAIDEALLEMSGIREYEQIEVYNVTNGERFTTYAIRAEKGSKIISVNGAAAHKADPQDRIIICSYASLNEEELQAFEPVMVYLNEKNEVTGTRKYIPVQRPVSVIA